MDKDKIIINFLNECGFICEKLDMLHGMQISREFLLNEQKYQ